MQQRRRVYELDSRRELARAVAAATQEARRRQGNQRSNTFAAGVYQMLREVRDDADGAAQIPVDDDLNGGEILGQ
jgi:hypothetical protein